MKAVRTLWIVALFAALMVSFGCGSTPPPESAEKAPEAAPAPTTPPAEAPTEQPPPEEVAKLEPPVTKAPAPKVVPKAPPGNPIVVMETSKGTIRIELDAAKAPNTVKNFLAYVDSGFYNGTIFHRVMSGFMIQGGGFTPAMDQKDTRPPIQNESANGLTNDRGTLAMARTGDPHSATAQFFINHGSNNAFLNKDQADDGWGYAVFGKVVAGMDVVDAIAAVPTGETAGMGNVPSTPVVIKSVKRAS